MRACLIFNPTARGHHAHRLHDHLAKLSAHCTLCPTQAPGHARTLAARAASQDYDTIIAAGGDGTVNEVLNGIGDVPDAFARVRFALLPVGTVNVFAREMRIPRHLLSAWRIITQNRPRTIDLPYAEFPRDGRTQRRYFIQMAGAGLDSLAIALVRPQDKKRWRSFAYVLAGLRALARTQSRITVASPNGNDHGELVLVGNGVRYGGSFSFFPNASLDDGLLDVLIYPRAHWLALVQVALGWCTGRLRTAGRARRFQTSQLSLSCPVPIPFEVDGENAACLPVTFGLSPKALTLLAPSDG